MKKRIFLLLLPLMAAGALAQDTIEEDEELDVRRYTVEIIIFAYSQTVSAGSEIFPPDVPVIDDIPLDEDPVNALESLPETVTEPDVSAELEEDTIKKYELVMLAEEDFGLVESYEHLERLDAYEPLMHFGWTQPTYPDEEVGPRPLSSFATPPAGLEGELTLYLSRYLHLVVKLQLDESFADEPVEDELERTPIRSGFDGGYYDYDYDEEEPASYPVRYRIDEDRIFRNGELRYFDHPKFGVLAKITRVEEEESDPDELTDNMEMLGD